MKRKKPLVRSTSIPRGKPPKRRARVKPTRRSASEFTRIYGGKARVEWIKRQPCAAIAVGAALGVQVVCAGPIENAHTTTGGMGRKADADTIIPLCHAHHLAFDQRLLFWLGFEARDMTRRCAREIESKWQQLASCAD